MGMSEKKKKIDQKIVRSPKRESFNELCKFADETNLRVEIHKPFRQLENIIINVINKSSDKIVDQVVLQDISSLDKQSAELLSSLLNKKK